MRNPTTILPSQRRQHLVKVTELAASQFGLTPDRVTSKKRGSESLAFCRWFIWRLAKEHGFTNHQLGRHFSRDHSTITYGTGQLAFMLGCYPEWREEWNDFYKLVQKNMKTKYLTRKQTANRLAVCDRSVDRWIRADRIQAIKVGRSVRIPEASVDKLIADCTVA